MLFKEPKDSKPRIFNHCDAQGILFDERERDIPWAFDMRGDVSGEERRYAAAAHAVSNGFSF